MLNREIVLFRSCMRTRGLVAKWNWISKGVAVLFPFLFGPAELSLFPFGADGLSLFPSHHPPNLQSNFSWDYRYYYVTVRFETP